jgi:hypothetical protein
MDDTTRIFDKLDDIGTRMVRVETTYGIQNRFKGVVGIDCRRGACVNCHRVVYNSEAVKQYGGGFA